MGQDPNDKDPNALSGKKEVGTPAGDMGSAPGANITEGGEGQKGIGTPTSSSGLGVGDAGPSRGTDPTEKTSAENQQSLGDALGENSDLKK